MSQLFRVQTYPYCKCRLETLLFAILPLGGVNEPRRRLLIWLVVLCFPTFEGGHKIDVDVIILKK